MSELPDGALSSDELDEFEAVFTEAMMKPILEHLPDDWQCPCPCHNGRLLAFHAKRCCEHPGVPYPCTGFGASWCPIHGDCLCPLDEREGSLLERTLNDPGCPVHAPNSLHCKEIKPYRPKWNHPLGITL